MRKDHKKVDPRGSRWRCVKKFWLDPLVSFEWRSSPFVWFIGYLAGWFRCCIILRSALIHHIPYWTSLGRAFWMQNVSPKNNRVVFSFSISCFMKIFDYRIWKSKRRCAWLRKAMITRYTKIFVSNNSIIRVDNFIRAIWTTTTMLSRHQTNVSCIMTNILSNIPVDI